MEWKQNLTTNLSTVVLENLRGVKFLQCTFKNTSGRTNVTAITAMNAGLTVRDGCINYFAPCAMCNTPTNPSIFEGFTLGINIDNAGNQYYVLVGNSEFKNNAVGIMLLGINNSCKIGQNKFINNSEYDILVGGSAGYKIDKNIFTGNNLNVGVMLYNSGTSNIFLNKNEFTNYNTAYLAVGTNGSNAGSGSGSQFTCNKFHSCSYDIKVLNLLSPIFPFGVIAAGTIHPYQGSLTAGADNEFNKRTATHLATNGSQVVQYYHNFGANREPIKFEPTPNTKFTIINQNVALNACTTTLCDEYLVIIKPQFVGPRGSSNPYTDMQDEYDLLLNEYVTNNYEVIVQQVERNNQNIPAALANRVAYVKTRLHELGNQMQEIRNNVIYYILNDSIVDYELLKDWLSIFRTPEAKYQLVELFYEQGNYIEADELLSTLPELFNYSELENIEYNNYQRFHELKNILAREDKKWGEDSELNALRSIRECKTGRSSAMASGILCFYYGDCESFEIPSFENNNIEPKSAMTTPAPPKDRNNSSIYVFPNPTNDFVEILSLEEDVTILSCEVYNLVGTKLLTVKTDNNPSLQLDLSKLENGIYSAKVTLSNGTVEMVKIVKL